MDLGDRIRSLSDEKKRVFMQTVQKIKGLNPGMNSMTAIAHALKELEGNG